MPKPPRPKLWNAQWERLRAAFAATLPRPCEVCGLPINPGDRWELDHRVPRSQGGAWYDPANLRPLHGACNRRDSWRLANLSMRRQRTAPPSRAW
jgi:5-methylcytosine-specific restriction endonuclease McrA